MVVFGIVGEALLENQIARFGGFGKVEAGVARADAARHWHSVPGAATLCSDDMSSREVG